MSTSWVWNGSSVRPFLHGLVFAAELRTFSLRQTAGVTRFRCAQTESPGAARCHRPPPPGTRRIIFFKTLISRVVFQLRTTPGQKCSAKLAVGRVKSLCFQKVCAEGSSPTRWACWENSGSDASPDPLSPATTGTKRIQNKGHARFFCAAPLSGQFKGTGHFRIVRSTHNSTFA